MLSRRRRRWFGRIGRHLALVVVLAGPLPVLGRRPAIALLQPALLTPERGRSCLVRLLVLLHRLPVALLEVPLVLPVEPRRSGHRPRPVALARNVAEGAGRVERYGRPQNSQHGPRGAWPEPHIHSSFGRLLRPWFVVGSSQKLR